MRSPDHAVVGMIVANHERHLLPAQVVRVEEEPKEVRYFLPLGLAIGVEALTEVLDEVGDDVQYAL